MRISDRKQTKIVLFLLDIRINMAGDYGPVKHAAWVSSDPFLYSKGFGSETQISVFSAYLFEYGIQCWMLKAFATAPDISFLSLRGLGFGKRQVAICASIDAFSGVRYNNGSTAVN